MNCRDCICVLCLNYYGCHIRKCDDCDYGTYHSVTDCPNFRELDHTEEQLDILREMARLN